MTRLAAKAPEWDRLSRRYDRQLWLERSAVRAALDLAAPLATDRLLDLGTGTGEVLSQLAARPRRPRVAVGVDASEAMLAQVQALPSGWSVRRGDVLALPFCSGEFDVAIASYLLHVLPEAVLPRTLAEIARVLRPGGRIVTVTPVIPQRGSARVAAVMCDNVARQAPRSLGGLRAFDPGPGLEQAGFRLVRGRVVKRGYPSLCVLALRPVCA
ncbi:MAG: class I SAM-dependent methyltransferase [Solirubrobacteraceae bacterium]